MRPNSNDSFVLVTWKVKACSDPPAHPQRALFPSVSTRRSYAISPCWCQSICSHGLGAIQMVTVIKILERLKCPSRHIHRPNRYAFRSVCTYRHVFIQIHAGHLQICLPIMLLCQRLIYRVVVSFSRSKLRHRKADTCQSRLQECKSKKHPKN